MSINEIISILCNFLPYDLSRKIVMEYRCLETPSCKIIKPFITLIREIPFEAMIGRSEKLIDVGEVIQIIPDYTKLNISNLKTLIDRQQRKERLELDITKK